MQPPLSYGRDSTSATITWLSSVKYGLIEVIIFVEYEFDLGIGRYYKWIQVSCRLASCVPSSQCSGKMDFRSGIYPIILFIFVFCGLSQPKVLNGEFWCSCTRTQHYDVYATYARECFGFNFVLVLNCYFHPDCHFYLVFT